MSTMQKIFNNEHHVSRCVCTCVCVYICIHMCIQTHREPYNSNKIHCEYTDIEVSRLPRITYICKVFWNWHRVVSVSNLNHMPYLQVLGKWNIIHWQCPAAFLCKNEPTRHWKVREWNQLQRGFLFGCGLSVFLKTKQNIKLFLGAFEFKTWKKLLSPFLLPHRQKTPIHF